MQYQNLNDFLSRGLTRLVGGPVGILLIEDWVEVDSTIRHHLGLGLQNLIVLGHARMPLAADLRERIHLVDFRNLARADAWVAAVNRLIPALQGRWVYYGFNAEYLFFPFCETRSLAEMTAFVTEEKRDSVLTYVVDLYADDLRAHPEAVSLENAHLDRAGYYALARSRNGQVMERQLDMFGGLRWRFEEHVPEHRRRIDRIGLFRARKGLELREDHTFNDEEYNTYSCPWHHNLTAAICSFRAAKALCSNPGSAERIDSLMWFNSCRFEWASEQLLDLGLIEPGQWF